MRDHPLVRTGVAVTTMAIAGLAAGCGPASGPDAASSLPRVSTPVGVVMVQVPGGWFDMGSASGPSDEQPRHRVWVDPFWIDTHEVTQEQYRLVQLSDPSRFQGPDLPVEQRTWFDAVRFCNARSRHEGLRPAYDEETGVCDFAADGYRLPTEAEWEYAARAGSTMAFGFGHDSRLAADHAWYAENSAETTHPVGRKRPNAWGLVDMAGNVAEWCHDAYDERYYHRSPQRNPRGAEAGELRVARGGGWRSSVDGLRPSARLASASVHDDCQVSDAIGFRCVRRVTATRR